MTSAPLFRGAVLVQTRQPLQIINGIRAPALKPGQALVKIRYAGLCHSQLMEAKGLRGPDNYLPHFLGHEGTGHVVETGPGVSKIKTGDEVVLGWIKGEGLEGGPSVYDGPEGMKINSGSVTTFSEYAVVSENRLVKKPVDTPSDLAVLYGCALPTGAGLVFNELKPKENAHIAVIGLGGIGLSALMAAAQFKPQSLIAIDIADDKLQFAKDMGASHVLQAGRADLIDQVKSIAGPMGVDYAIEAAGLTQTIELGFGLIKRGGGQLIFASHPKAGDKIAIDPFELICGKSIRGTWGGGSKPDQDIPLLGQMYRQGRLNLAPLLSHRYRLDQVNEALHDLEHHKIVRALLEIGD